MLKFSEIEKAHIELSSYCNSACPTCPRTVDGGITNPLLSTNSLSLQDFKKIFTVNFLKQIKSINFCGNYGDPVMCKDFLKIIQYITRSNNELDVVVHTNGGMRNTDFWSTLGRFNKVIPLLTVVFSIDGLEDTNHLYRINVKWDRVINNAKAFINSGGRAIWDMLVFKHNEHQVKEAEEMSKELGFFRFIQGDPHGFKYNNTIRVVDRNGNFERLIHRATMFENKNDFASNKFEKIDFNLDKKTVIKIFNDAKDSSLNRSNSSYELLMKKLREQDIFEIKHCLAKHDKEIYIDSNGGVHPCCYLGHINQEGILIPELILHKKWIEDTIGFDKINAIKYSLNTIIDSDYFSLIEKSWHLTFDQGRNPMCVMKCGIQRPNGLIRT
jgi:MoaA/NifB/PqqE/SkfB family radical SAM enzyme